MKNFFKAAFGRTAAYYTLAVLLFSLLTLITNASAETISMDPVRILLFLPFCFSFAVANTLMTYKTIEAVTRWGVHFALTIISAFLCIILPANISSPSGNFTGIMLIIAVYFLGVLIYAIFASRIRKTLAEDKKLRNTKRVR